MDKRKVAIGPKRFGFVARTRSLMVAGALVTTGIIMANMVYLYMSDGAIVGGVPRSRLWWEIVLNFQILSVGFVWFAYSDIIGMTEAKRKYVYILQCCFVCLSLLMPSFVGAIAVWNNWFETRPPESAFWVVVAAGILNWAVGLILQHLHWRRSTKNKAGNTVTLPLSQFLPLLVLAVVLVVDVLTDGNLWWIAMPFLLYLQSAMAFILDGFGWR